MWKCVKDIVMGTGLGTGYENGFEYVYSLLEGILVVHIRTSCGNGYRV